MNPHSSNRPSRAALLLWISLGVLLSALLTIARARILVRHDFKAYGLGDSPEMGRRLSEWRIAQGLSAEWPPTLGLGLLAVFLLSLGLRRGSLAAISSWLAGSALVAVALLGAPWATPDHQLAIYTSTQPALLAALLALAAALAGAFRFALIRGCSEGANPLLGRYAGLLSCLLLIPILPASYEFLTVGGNPTLLANRVQREIVLETGAWTVLDEHAAQSPSSAILTPSTDYRADAGDLPTLIMPPPCEVSFEITTEDGEVDLTLAAGVDQHVGKKRGRRNRFEFGFEVEVNGESVFEATIPAFRELANKQKSWVRPQQTLRVKPGDVVHLRTWIVGMEREAVLALEPQRIGFGGLLLEKRVEFERAQSSAETPNIVLIVQDTMRADRSSTYGYEKPTTPALGRLAARGILYEQAHSCSSWTWPATASILTGLLPNAHGVTDDSTCYLSGRNETLAEALQARGYTTGAFTCNPLIVPSKNFDQGFEFFSSDDQGFRKTPSLMWAIKAWMGRQAGSRFFLYLHLVDPHAPHKPRGEDLMRLGADRPADYPDESPLHAYNLALLQGRGWDEHGKLRPDVFPTGNIEYLSDLYDACLASGDYYLGAIVDHIETLGLTGKTIVVFTSDHGEEWMDHGLLTHGQHIHRELVRVPLVLAGPGLPQGVRCDKAVSNRHIAGTLARFGGAHLDNIIDPIDLGAPAQTQEQPVFYATSHGYWNGRRGRQQIYGVRDKHWVAHLAPEGSAFGVPKALAPAGGQLRLYDLRTDPWEHVDVADKEPSVAKRLRKLILDSLADQARQLGNVVSLEAGESTLKMLKGIGYMDGVADDEEEDTEEDEKQGKGTEASGAAQASETNKDDE